MARARPAHSSASGRTAAPVNAASPSHQQTRCLRSHGFETVRRQTGKHRDVDDPKAPTLASSSWNILPGRQQSLQSKREKSGSSQPSRRRPFGPATSPPAHKPRAQILQMTAGQDQKARPTVESWLVEKLASSSVIAASTPNSATASTRPAPRRHNEPPGRARMHRASGINALSPTQ